jgi:4-amino-4-deoxy-L-arabinose transferase-like glycosyltransferase
MGERSPGEPARLVIRPVQNCGATSVLTRQLFANSRVALTAAALYALEPLSVMYSSILLSETLFATMVVWALVLLVDAVGRDRRGTLVAGTALLAASAYVRPVSYFLPLPLLGLIGGYAAVTRRPRLLVAAGVAACVAIIVIGPWLVRNRALGFRGMSALHGRAVL